MNRGRRGERDVQQKRRKTNFQCTNCLEEVGPGEKRKITQAFFAWKELDRAEVIKRGCFLNFVWLFLYCLSKEQINSVATHQTAEVGKMATRPWKQSSEINQELNSPPRTRTCTGLPASFTPKQQVLSLRAGALKATNHPLKTHGSPSFPTQNDRSTGFPSVFK